MNTLRITIVLVMVTLGAIMTHSINNGMTALMDAKTAQIESIYNINK